MSTKVAVVIPTYKEELNEFEKISLAQVRKVLGKYPLVFAAPEGKNLAFARPCDLVAYFPPQFFKDVAAYNRLMMSPQFYEAFLDFDYILIYELDAFVFYDALEFFCALGYDYIGAPWPAFNPRKTGDKVLRVGNSGFCLRKVKAHYDFLNEQRDLTSQLMGVPNDDFFAFCGVREDINFKVPPVYVAARFSLEYLLEHAVKNLGNKLPFGCHGWSKMSADFYVKLFARFGYDLRPFRSRMKNLDTEIIAEYLERLAINRLARGIKRGQSVLQYLPTKKFASVRVIRSPESMKILAGMIQEDYLFTDKIFLYDLKDYPKLINDLRRENLPHLVLSAECDESLIKQIEERGLIYGEHVISFRREYLKHCEKIFHNLGK
ncbi:MAG: hypothetical protein II857_02995 [Selenomonadaceae bacterium]|nr:hypothetical protein [Selenomonadaceae bacterium]